MLATSQTAALTACLLLLAGLFASFPVSAQDAVTEELSEVRAEINRREREIAQYRASMDLLRANGANAMDSPALQALAEELGRTRAVVNQLTEREQALSAQLQRRGNSPSGDGAEVDRLTSLLQGYYADAEAAQQAEAEASAALASVALMQTELDHGKVLLSGTEGVAAINLISERLARRPSEDYSRQRNIVFNVEIRDNGRMVSKSNHSLQPVGESQFVGKVTLGGGDAIISIRSEEWRVQLAERGDYLLTLYTPASGDTHLHIIPVAALRATRWTEAPTWLPSLGDTASRS